MRGVLAIASTALLVQGCNGTPNRLRFASTSIPVSEPGDPTLSVTSIAAEPTPPLTLRDLPGETGAAHATALATKSSGAAEYLSNLAASIARPPQSDRDRTTLQRVIAIDVSPGGYEAGKRLVRTKVTMVPLGPFKFAGYTLAKTDYQTIDLETITSTRKTTGALTLKPSLGNVVEAGEASVGFENTDQAVYGSRERSRELSIGFSSSRIVVTRDGLPNGDLAGMTLLKTSVRPDPTAAAPARPPKADTANPAPKADAPRQSEATPPFLETVVTDQDLFTIEGNDLEPARAAVRTSTDLIWRPQSLRVCARLEYVERRVLDGREFYDEGKQRVEERSRMTKAKVFELVPEEDTNTQLFRILSEETGRHLQLSGPTGHRTITFTNLIAAASFADWASRTGANRIGGRTLAYGGRTIPIRRGRRLRVDLVNRGGTPDTHPIGSECPIPAQ